jgi:hypothetical protein
MGKTRRVFCVHCEQSFVTDRVDRCALCGKEGGLATSRQAIAALCERRATERSAEYRSEVRTWAYCNIVLGALLFLLGLGVTLGTYLLASHGGVFYVVAWGTMAAGAGQFIRGLTQVLQRERSGGAVTGRPSSPEAAEGPPSP